MGCERMISGGAVRPWLPPRRAAILISCFSLVLWLAAGSSGRLQAQNPGVYEINTKASRIEIHLYKAGFLSGLGDKHLIELTRFTGVAELLETQPWHAQVTAQTGSLKVLDPWASVSQRKEVEETMLGPRQIDASRFPLITLQSVTFAPAGHEKAWHLSANLTLHGVTRPEKFLLSWRRNGDHLRVEGKKMLRLRDFNIQPISRAFGAVKVKNTFEVTYDITLDRKR